MRAGGGGYLKLIRTDFGMIGSRISLRDAIEVIGQKGSDVSQHLPEQEAPSQINPVQRKQSQIPLRVVERPVRCKNPNHPKKGSVIRVEPIRKLEDIERIRQLLADRPRDLALFAVGINTNLRASDIVRLTIGQVRDLKPLESFEIREKKTKKIRRLNFNQSVTAAIAAYLQTLPPDVPGDTPLFASNRGGGPLTVPTVNRLVKSWCRKIQLRGNYGSHTLRKTFGYHQRVTFGTDLPTLMVCFNHSNQAQTLAYLCVQAEEIREVYSHEI